MLVSHGKKFIYLKTRKTGGTSVEVALEPYALPEKVEHREDTQTDTIESEAGIVGARTRNAARSRFYNHMGAKDLAALLPAEVWEGYVKICNVRNPWDKVVSKYHWFRRKQPPQSKDATIGQFREWIQETGDLAEDFEVYTIDGKVVADEVIMYHRLDDDFARVCRRLEIPVVELPKYKAKARGRSERIPYVDYYDDAARSVVAEKFAPEIELFSWTFGENV